MSIWPKPHPEISVDYRVASPAAADIRVGPFQLPGVDMAKTLRERRGGVAQPLELAEVSATEAALVVEDHVLVSNTSGGGAAAMQNWKPQADVALGRAQYVRDNLSLLSAYPELDARLQAYKRAGRAPIGRQRDLVRPDVVGALPPAASGGLEYALALQETGQIVVKAPGGAKPAAVDLPAALHGPAQGGPIVVAVIDTGIVQSGRSEDGLLDEVDRNGSNVDALDAFPNGGDGFLDFSAGHGTFAAGVVRLVDAEATVRMYRAMDSDGAGSEVAVACAMMQAVKDGAHIINLSLGTHTVDDQPLVSIEAALDAIDAIVAQTGQPAPVFVASAGNAGSSRPVWPAASPRVIAVAALTQTSAADWSSFGDWVQFSAIGEGVVSTYVQGSEPNGSDGSTGDAFGPNAWATWSGTSFTAPQIAGAIALTCRKQGCTPQEAITWLETRGVAQAGFGFAMELLPGS